MARKNNVVATLRTGATSIQEFLNSNLPLEAWRQRAEILLTSKDLVRTILGMAPEDQTKFLDKVDQIYPTLELQDAKYVTALGNACSATQRLPASAVISAGLEKCGLIAPVFESPTDIWRGDLGYTQVAIKTPRIYSAQILKEAKEILWKRVPVWRRLSHPNILPFRGVDMTLFSLSLVYDWGQGGNITQYISSHPHASRPSLILGVAKGVEYLHSLGIPHGDIKGANVVIDQRGTPRLTEYGLAPINSDPNFTIPATSRSIGSSRWQAPEITRPPRKGSAMPVMESKAGDIFAFGMLGVEVFTGKIPFEGLRNEVVLLHISRGSRPEMPRNAHAVGLTVEMWKVLESCWQQNPKKRPEMREVVKKWEGFVEDGGELIIFSEKPQPAAEPVDAASRRRANSEVTQPKTRSLTLRNRKSSEVVGSRTRPELARLRTTSDVVRVGLGDIPLSPNSEANQQTPYSGATQKSSERKVAQQRPKVEGFPLTQVYDPPPTPKRKKCYCGLF